MADRYDVAIKVISQNGYCANGHKVGDEWVIKDDVTTGGICLEAFHALFPQLWTLIFNGSFPWSDDLDTVQVTCPDGKNPVTFELRRLKK